MSRLRKIYKGEENWDILYNEQELILGTKIKNAKKENNDNNLINNINTISNPIPNKTFREDNKSGLTNNRNSDQARTNYNTNFNNPLNTIANKLSNVAIVHNKDMSKIDNDNIDETDIQDLVFDNLEAFNCQNDNVIINNDKGMDVEVNERDYDNFDNFDRYSNISENKSVTVKSNYKNEKRTFSEAFGAGYVNEESLAEDEGSLNKKFKLA
jgi:hypothetical protein